MGGDGGMVMPKGYKDYKFPIVRSNPRLKDRPDHGTENKADDAPANPYGGTRKQSKY